MIPKGTVFTVTTGNYSEAHTMATFRACQDIDDQALIVAYGSQRRRGKVRREVLRPLASSSHAINPPVVLTETVSEEFVSGGPDDFVRFLRAAVSVELVPVMDLHLDIDHTTTSSLLIDTSGLPAEDTDSVRGAI